MVNLFTFFTQSSGQKSTITKEDYQKLLDHIEQLNLENVQCKDELNKLHNKYQIQNQKLISYISDVNLIEKKLNEALGITVQTNEPC